MQFPIGELIRGFNWLSAGVVKLERVSSHRSKLDEKLKKRNLLVPSTEPIIQRRKGMQFQTYEQAKVFLTQVARQEGAEDWIIKEVRELPPQQAVKVLTKALGATVGAIQVQER